MRQFRFETKKFFTMAFFALSLFAFVGCDDDDDDDNVVLPDTNGTIVEVASQSGNFSLLVAAITKVSTETDTDVAALLSGDTEYTVFAPTNAAFNAAGFPNEAAIEAADADVLLGILTYHVITGEVLAPNVPAGPNAMQNTLADENIFLTNRDGDVFVNGNEVSTANIQADNGVIHEIGVVLIPSGGSNIAEIVTAEPDFSELLRVIQYVDDNTDSDLAGALSDAESTFTVFAPTDAAFITALDGADGSDTNNAIEEAELDALGAEALLAILQLHVVSGQVFSSDLPAPGSTIDTINENEDITYSNNDTGTSPTLLGGGNLFDDPEDDPDMGPQPAPVNITGTNRVASNGVIHTIDGVLLTAPEPTE